MRNFCKEETLKLLLGKIYASWRHDIKHNNIYNIDIQHINAQPIIKLDAENNGVSFILGVVFYYRYAEYRILSVFMPRVHILSVVMPSVVIPSVVAACQLSLLLEVSLLCVR